MQGRDGGQFVAAVLFFLGKKFFFWATYLLRLFDASVMALLDGQPSYQEQAQAVVIEVGLHV